MSQSAIWKSEGMVENYIVHSSKDNKLNKSLWKYSVSFHNTITSECRNLKMTWVTKQWCHSALSYKRYHGVLQLGQGQQNKAPCRCQWYVQLNDHCCNNGSHVQQQVRWGQDRKWSEHGESGEERKRDGCGEKANLKEKQLLALCNKCFRTDLLHTTHHLQHHNHHHKISVTKFNTSRHLSTKNTTNTPHPDPSPRFQNVYMQENEYKHLVNILQKSKSEKQAY